MSADRLAAMEIFVRVVDAGSFSAAAAQLRIGQPAVSKVIAQLEERLGVQLLLRSTRSLGITEAGQTFYDNAKRAIESVNQAEASARGDGGLAGTLRVSASVCFTRLHIMPHLPEFLAQHADTDIEITTDDRFVDLVEQGMDVALRTGTLTDSSLTVRKIGQASRRVMATAKYFERHGKPKTLDDLLQHECVILQRNGRLLDEWPFRRGANEALTKVRGRLKVTSGEGLREAVLSDLGIAVASEWLFSPELTSGAVEAVLGEWTLPVQDLWSVFPTGKQVSAKARAFVAYVERCMAAPFAPSPIVLRSLTA
jgi:DNA-binding transcriptional LysR family regulator